MSAPPYQLQLTAWAGSGTFEGYIMVKLCVLGVTLDDLRNNPDIARDLQVFIDDVAVGYLGGLGTDLCTAEYGLPSTRGTHKVYVKDRLGTKSNEATVSLDKGALPDAKITSLTVTYYKSGAKTTESIAEKTYSISADPDTPIQIEANILNQCGPPVTITITPALKVSTPDESEVILEQTAQPLTIQAQQTAKATLPTFNMLSKTLKAAVKILE